MAITAKDVAALRQRTGLGMMDCKAALNETNGDMEAAMELLRKKLKGKMDERTDRAAGEGVIAAAVSADGKSVAMIELNSETDFAARNDSFVEAASKIAAMALESSTAGEIQATPEMTALVDNLRITIKENISLRRGIKLTGSKVGSYVHHTRKLGTVIEIEGDLDDETLVGICQHVAAHVPTPMAVDEAGLPQDEVEKHRAEAIAEAENSGKPREIAEKMAIGKLRKWVDENTLLGQKYVKDPSGKASVADIVGKNAKVKTFVRYIVGG